MPVRPHRCRFRMSSSGVHFSLRIRARKQTRFLSETYVGRRDCTFDHGALSRIDNAFIAVYHRDWTGRQLD